MDKAIKKRIEQIARGEAPEGYEKTAFGIFPCDWVKDSPLGSLFDFYGGLGKSRDELGEDGYPYLHYGDLHMGSFKVVSYNQYLQLPRCAVEIKGNDTYLMRDGDVAFLDASEDLTGTSRAVLIENPSNEPFIAGLHIIYGHSKDDSLTKWYKQYITAETSVKKQFQKLAVGFKVYGINRNTLTKIKYSFPKSTEEQRKIADILMLWDKAIELKEKLIAEKYKQKQYLMDVLFTGKVRLPGFSDDWERVELKDICQIKKGEQINKQMLTSSGKYPVINGGISPSGYYSQYNREAGTISISEGGNSCGHVAMNEESFWSGGHCYTIHDIVSQVDGKYLFYYLKQNERAIKSMRVGSGLPNIQLNSLKRMFVEFPSYTYQRKIADLLSTLDNSLVALYKQLILQRKQRDALMQLLLTGIVRVKYE